MSSSVNKSRFMRATGLLVGISLLLPVFSNPVNAQSFRNCAAVRAKYPEGVARDYNVVFTGAFHVSRRIYRANQRMDIDQDGVICETEVVNPTALTTVPPTTTIPHQVPAGSWINLQFQSRDRLLFGRGYRFYTCANGSSATEMSVQIGTEWVVKARAVIRQEQTLCTDPSFPVAHSYFWIVDVRGPNEETAILTRLNGFSRSVENTRVVVLSETSLTTTTTTTTTPTRTGTIGSGSGSSASASMRWSSLFSEYSLSSWSSVPAVAINSRWSSLFQEYSVSGSMGTSYVSLTSRWSNLFKEYSISGSIGTSYVSLTSRWSSLFQEYSISGSIGTSYVSLTMRWSSLFQQYSISGSIGSSFVSMTMRWSSLFQEYSISGNGPASTLVILAATTDPVLR